MKKLLVKVAGISFAVNDTPELATARPAGAVVLVAEPNNKFDKEAIRLDLDGTKIGYVPKHPSADRAAIFEFQKVHGKFPEAFVEDYSYKPAGTKDFNHDHVGILASIKIAVDIEAVTAEDHNFSHYKKDGEQYERASTILEAFDAEGAKGVEGSITRWMLDTFENYNEYRSWMTDAADKGTALHSATEGACKSGVLDADGRDAIETAVKALSDAEFNAVPVGFWNFIAKDCSDLKVVGLEETVFDQDTFVAGTYDCLIEGGGKTIVVDWKSAKQVNIEHIIKTCFYAKLKDADEAWVVCFGSKNKCGYQLKKVGRESIENGYQIMKQAAKAFYFVKDLKASIKKGL